jgi:hypothetical protein
MMECGKITKNMVRELLYGLVVTDTLVNLLMIEKRVTALWCTLMVVFMKVSGTMINDKESENSLGLTENMKVNFLKMLFMGKGLWPGNRLVANTMELGKMVKRTAEVRWFMRIKAVTMVNGEMIKEKAKERWLTNHKKENVHMKETSWMMLNTDKVNIPGQMLKCTTLEIGSGVKEQVMGYVLILTKVGMKELLGII